MSDSEDPYVQLLVRHGRRTAARWWILKTLAQATAPCSPDELAAAIAAATPSPPDRVTIYRTLEWLVAQGLVRRIAATDRAARYELNADRPHHPHFLCHRCGEVRCLEPAPVALPPMPPGYAPHRAEVVVHGLCPHCSQALSPK